MRHQTVQLTKKFELHQKRTHMAEKPNDILNDFHEVLQRCCKLEDTLLKNIGLLNCIKNNELTATKDLEKSQEKLQILTQKTNDVEQEMCNCKGMVLQRGEDLKALEERCSKTVNVYEKNKEKFQQLLEEIEREKTTN